MRDLEAAGLACDFRWKDERTTDMACYWLNGFEAQLLAGRIANQESARFGGIARECIS
jgi:hypothetical protein